MTTMRYRRAEQRLTDEGRGRRGAAGLRGELRMKQEVHLPSSRRERKDRERRKDAVPIPEGVVSQTLPPNRPLLRHRSKT
ncbi:hypothetical protein B296_00040029 [Ensete ventricosum]|uniref:Uncharacterized protein n=1 Tax=Ensete ventricosum TaxID=4639 RepID=A0A426Y0C8_ENSVE|nr:hypothetical protein B296_00040029 [Ensete ventricosum]